jgi:hypothetical protein
MEAIKAGGDMPVLVSALQEAQAERAQLEKAAGGAQRKARHASAMEPVERRVARARAALAEGDAGRGRRGGTSDAAGTVP